jgi:hypothetical protein
MTNRIGLGQVTDSQAMARRRVAEHDLPLIVAASQRRQNQIRTMTHQITHRAEKEWGKWSKEARSACRVANNLYRLLTNPASAPVPEYSLKLIQGEGKKVKMIPNDYEMIFGPEEKTIPDYEDVFGSEEKTIDDYEDIFGPDDDDDDDD